MDSLGASPSGDGTAEVRVWAPACEQVSVRARNHDQVGNRARGERLAGDALRVAAAVTLFSPCTPLLFMGEERFETAPVVDEEAKILRLRRGHVTLVADFGNRRVEFSR